MKFKINLTGETVNRTALAEIEVQTRVINEEMNKLRRMLDRLVPVTIEFEEETKNPRHE